MPCSAVATTLHGITTQRYPTTTLAQCHSLEDLDLKHVHCESLKTQN